MAKRLTRKQSGFVKSIVKGKTGVQAALENYDTEDYATAGVIAVENLEKPKIRAAIEEALPDDMLNAVHREGLYATKPVFKEGELVSEEADFSSRAKYLDMAYKRRGLYAPEKHINTTFEFKVDDPALEEAAKAYGAAVIKRKTA